MIYLYLKQHNKTGLKYLGQTKHDPATYKGSGTRWLNHLKKHGDDVTTEILIECNNDESLSSWGLHYSMVWDIVNNENFANLIPERGNQQYFPVENKNAKFKGCKWINNGADNKKLLKGEALPDGFELGRTAAVAQNMKRSHQKLSVKEKLRKRRRPHKKKSTVYQHICGHCGINFERKTKAKTENVFCGWHCRGKATTTPEAVRKQRITKNSKEYIEKHQCKCPHCGEIILTKSNLRQHIKAKHKEKSLT